MTARNFLALAAALTCSLSAKTPELRGPLTLDRAVNLALKNNAEILRAKKEIERTRGQVLEVRAEALPHVMATTSYRQEDPTLLERSSGGAKTSLAMPDGSTVSFGNALGDFNTNDKTWRVNVEARQVIYSPKLGAAMRLAKVTENQSIHVMRETADRVVATTRAQFYAVLLNRKLITVAEESIRLLEDELKDQQNRFGAGTVPKFNVLRAEVAVANARPDLIRAKNNHLIAQLELAKTLGLDAASNGKVPFEVTGELRASGRKWDLSRALAAARNQRSSLKAQNEAIRGEQEQITIAEAGRKPQLDASAGWQFQNSRRTDELGHVVNGRYFGVTGQWDIFDGLATKGRVQQAGARLDSARIAYTDAVQQVELEVQRAFARIREAQELIASQGKVLEQADEALRLARERLAAGAGTQLDVLDAQVALTKARTTQQQALYDYNVATAEYDRATGAQTFRDDTLPAPTPERARQQLRKGKAELRAED